MSACLKQDAYGIKKYLKCNMKYQKYQIGFKYLKIALHTTQGEKRDV